MVHADHDNDPETTAEAISEHEELWKGEKKMNDLPERIWVDSNSWFEQGKVEPEFEQRTEYMKVPKGFKQVGWYWQEGESSGEYRSMFQGFEDNPISIQWYNDHNWKPMFVNCFIPSRVNRWTTMDSAPWNTEVLLTGSSGVGKPHDRFVINGYRKRDWHGGEWNDATGTQLSEAYGEPTHWQPLMEAPHE